MALIWSIAIVAGPVAVLDCVADVISVSIAMAGPIISIGAFIKAPLEELY
jgi:hypothetical protein